MDAWMDRLAAGVQAGYYRVEDDSGPLCQLLALGRECVRTEARIQEPW